MTNAPIPVRPARQSPSPSVIERACFAALVARNANERPAVAAARLWPDDKLPAMALGAKSAQTLGTLTGWGSDLVTESVAAFFASLGPLSAIAQIIDRGVSIPMGAADKIGIPYRSAEPGVAPWVGEGEPTRVLSYGFSSAELGPTRKAATITVVSGELVRRSGAEPIFRRMLREDAGRTLDAAYLSTDAATSAGAAGLLYGVTARTSFGDPREDMADLAKAVSSSGEVVFITSAARAASAKVLQPELAPLILASPALADDRVVAVDPAALLHGFGGEPEITTSIEALVHMSDDGDPIRASGVTADPVRSLFQTDAVAVRMVTTMAFAKTSSRAVAFMDDVAW